ncbi:hypothetical protein [Dyella nitratireducens]|uniref:hypothetical protein n=1 Tax=Dyella nitratireducens TaxID=1849580 RepID=UPI00166B198E|nr:hypothetical protein [Dyella nitratireducens]
MKLSSDAEHQEKKPDATANRNGLVISDLPSCYQAASMAATMCSSRARVFTGLTTSNMANAEKSILGCSE